MLGDIILHLGFYVPVPSKRKNRQTLNVFMVVTYQEVVVLGRRRQGLGQPPGKRGRRKAEMHPRTLVQQGPSQRLDHPSLVKPVEVLWKRRQVEDGLSLDKVYLLEGQEGTDMHKEIVKLWTAWCLGGKGCQGKTNGPGEQKKVRYR